MLLRIEAKQILKLKDELYHIIADHSNKTRKQIEADADRDYWMTAKEAMDYGMIDQVLIKTNNSIWQKRTILQSF